MSRTLAFATSSLVLAFSLGCSMGDSGTSTTPAATDAGDGETCCCEYKEEGATAPSYSDMAQSNCESWGYACVDDDKCADGGDEPTDDGAEAEADGEADEDAEEADAEEAEAEAEDAPAPAPTRTIRPTGGTMTRGKTLTRDGGGSKTGGSSSGGASGGKVMKRR